MLDAGRLVALSAQRLPAELAHYFVYPPRSARHPALIAFQTWLVAAAARLVREATAPPRARSKRGSPA
jgi:LysR family transcriptional regulator, glycine cleavage system transcriptional activator